MGWMLPSWNLWSNSPQKDNDQVGMGKLADSLIIDMTPEERAAMDHIDFTEKVKIAWDQMDDKEKDKFRLNMLTIDSNVDSNNDLNDNSDHDDSDDMAFEVIKKSEATKTEKKVEIFEIIRSNDSNGNINIKVLINPIFAPMLNMEHLTIAIREAISQISR